MVLKYIDQILINEQRTQALCLAYPMMKYNIDKKCFSLIYVLSQEKFATYQKSEFNCTIFFTTTNNLDIFMKNNMDNKSGVYKLTSNDCPIFSIGQIGRSFKESIHEGQI